VIADDDRIDGRYLEVHQGVLSLLARQAPVAGDLRRIAALLHVIRCVERMGDQCVNIAKLVPLSGEQAPTDTAILEAFERMGQLARREVISTRQAFQTRHVALARDLIGHSGRIGRLNREIFIRAVQIGDNAAMREWAMFMILVARALERIGDNAVAIAEQTVFVVTAELLGMDLRLLMALSYLGDHDGAPQQELVDALCMDAKNVVLLLNELEDSGHLVRRRDPEDRRRHRVHITPAGGEALARAARAQESIENEVLQALDAEERAILWRLLARALHGAEHADAEADRPALAPAAH
jgi:phosphate transport system protein